MKKASPVPKFLPIRVNIAWAWRPDKNLDNIHVNPFDNVDQLINQLGVAYEQRGDSVVDWQVPKLQFKIVGPLAGFDGQVDEQDAGEENKEDVPRLSQERVIDDIRAPFATYQLA